MSDGLTEILSVILRKIEHDLQRIDDRLTKIEAQVADLSDPKSSSSDYAYEITMPITSPTGSFSMTSPFGDDVQMDLDFLDEDEES